MFWMCAWVCKHGCMCKWACLCVKGRERGTKRDWTTADPHTSRMYHNVSCIHCWQLPGFSSDKVVFTPQTHRSQINGFCTCTHSAVFGQCLYHISVQFFSVKTSVGSLLPVLVAMFSTLAGSLDLLLQQRMKGASQCGCIRVVFFCSEGGFFFCWLPGIFSRRLWNCWFVFCVFLNTIHICVHVCGWTLRAASHKV